MKFSLLVKTLFTITLLIAFSLILKAQSTYSLQGLVQDSATNEPLINAAIYIKPSNKGIITNAKGEFTVNIEPGLHTIEVSYLGYYPLSKKITINSSTKTILKLSKQNINVENVDVLAKKTDDNIRNNKAGTISITTKEIDKLPTLMGEVDIINAIKLTPGVQAGGEGNPGLYVRGGDAGQNLIEIDRMTLYNPSHLLGFFPAFNADIIDNVDVYKGAIPAQYSGRASSVIDITMKEGSNEHFKGSGNIGLLSASTTLETPINNSKGSLIASGRRTYLNGVKTLAQPFIKSKNSFFNNTNYFFYDGSLKLRYNVTNKTKLFVTAFGSKDYYILTDTEYDVRNTMNWTNTAAGIRINHIFSQNFFANVASSITSFDYNIDAAFGRYNFNLGSGIKDHKSSFDFTYLGTNSLKLKFGADYIRHILTPNKIDVNAGEITFENTNRFYSNELSTYFQFNKSLNNKLSFSGGIRGTYYEHVGPYTHYIRNSLSLVSDSVLYKNNERVKHYITIDPNVNFIYVFNAKSSIKGSASMANQFIHLASVGTVSLPTDVWLPTTSFIKPQNVYQLSTGYFRNFKENTFETSVELYYKYLNNQVDFLNGVLDNFDNTKIENNILQGSGMAFGAEFYAKKTIGKTSGWISYTISKTLRRFHEINNGDYFSAKYDRVHDFSVTLNHKLSKKWEISGVFVYATGNAMTLPAGRYIIQGNVANHYTSVNSFRMPAYHRLDLSARYSFKNNKRFKSWLNISVYNVYNRTNPYFIYFAIEGDLEHYKLSVAPKQISLFPILPSVTWVFKF